MMGITCKQVLSGQQLVEVTIHDRCNVRDYWCVHNFKTKLHMQDIISDIDGGIYDPGTGRLICVLRTTQIRPPTAFCIKTCWVVGPKLFVICILSLCAAFCFSEKSFRSLTQHKMAFFTSIM